MARDLTDRRLTLTGAKILTVVLTVPAVLIALKGYDILRLFLIADLVAAATVVPVFLGLRRPASSASVIVGSLAGLASVVVLGVIQEGTLEGGHRPADGGQLARPRRGLLHPAPRSCPAWWPRPSSACSPEATGDRSAELGGGLAVDQPDDLLGPDPGGRGLARDRAGQGLGLLGAADRDEGQAGPLDAAEGQRLPGVGVGPRSGPRS